MSDAKALALTLSNDELEKKLVDHKAKITEASDKATPLLDESRRLRDEGQKLLADVEDDRVMAHAIMEVQKERS